jgi:hypothetical protein
LLAAPVRPKKTSYPVAPPDGDQDSVGVVVTLAPFAGLESVTCAGGGGALA